MPGLPLSLYEREEIAVALIEDPGVAWAVIGRRVGRHPTTIAREVATGGGRGCYRPAAAQKQAEGARGRPRARRLGAGALRDRVVVELRQGRSPEAIWADLVAEDACERVCVETIYASLYAGVLGVKATECLCSRRPRRRSRQARHTHNRPGLANISGRSAAADDRSEPGHWEADHLIGRANRSALMCLTERVSRYSMLITMPNGYRAADALDGLAKGIEQIPQHLRRSITFDQGSEWALWPQLADTFKMDVWFCDPHSPWQNAWIESFNGRMRDEHLNGQQFDSLLEAQVLTEDWRIDYNMNRPHSAHGWLTPVEFVEAWLHRQAHQLA